MPDNESRNEYIQSSNYILLKAQQAYFPKVYESLLNEDFSNPLVTQMNLFLEEHGLIRVQSKLRTLKASYGEKCPVLLGKSCPVAKSIIWDTHTKLGHAGIYKTISTLRKDFWITQSMVVVKNVIRSCLVCKRQNSRTVKINQNAYK